MYRSRFIGVLMSLHQFLLSYVGCGHLLIEVNPHSLIRFFHGTKNSLCLVQHTESQLVVVHLDVPVGLDEKDLNVGAQVEDLVLFILI